MDHNKQEKQYHDRARRIALCSLLAAVLCAYVAVLYSTQIVHGASYLEQSVRTITQRETVEASRGILTDRNGRTLVSNRSSYNLTFDSSRLDEDEEENASILRLLLLCRERNVVWQDNLLLTAQAPFSYTVDTASDTQKGRFIKYLQSLKLVSDTLKTADLTAGLLEGAGLTPDKLLARMRTEYQVPSVFSDNEARAVLGVQYELAIRKLVNTTAYILAEDVDAEMISLLTDGNYAGVRITTSSVREYETDAAAHILGTVGRINDYTDELKQAGYNLDDWIGKTGAELAFEEYLRGADGTRIVSTNADGKITSELYSTEPKPGGTVALTIDLNLQQAAEAALAETVRKMNAEDGNTTRGAGVAVIEVGTGQTLALASFPTFDLSSYNAEFTALSSNPAKPLFNRATNGVYAPGSTFKPLTAVAALEEGKITPSSTIRTTGHWTYPGSSDYANCWIYNSTRGSHGSINVTQAITVSCNYFFAEMGYRLGLDKLNAYASAFGLGQHTGIEIGDSAGALAEEEAGQNLAPWAAFGQANYLFTPLQLANYMATLVNGGDHYEAHLLKSVKSYDNSSILFAGDTAPVNSLHISDSTLRAVKKGMRELTVSGSLSSYFRNCVVDAGAKTGTAQISKDTKNNGVFVCFAPYDDPEIALAIVIEKGGSGSALASTAVEILNTWFTADEIGAAILGENQLLS